MKVWGSQGESVHDGPTPPPHPTPPHRTQPRLPCCCPCCSDGGCVLHQKLQGHAARCVYVCVCVYVWGGDDTHTHNRTHTHTEENVEAPAGCISFSTTALPAMRHPLSLPQPPHASLSPAPSAPLANGGNARRGSFPSRVHACPLTSEAVNGCAKRGMCMQLAALLGYHRLLPP